MLQRLVLGLLAAAGTAATLAVGNVHGSMIVVVVGCAALTAGLIVFANTVQKKHSDLSIFLVLALQLAQDRY